MRPGEESDGTGADCELHDGGESDRGGWAAVVDVDEGRIGERGGEPERKLVVPTKAVPDDDALMNGEFGGFSGLAGRC